MNLSEIGPPLVIHYKNVIVQKTCTDFYGFLQIQGPIIIYGQGGSGSKVGGGIENILRVREWASDKY